MKIIKDVHTFPKPVKPITLAAGFFDGVHLGHRSILERSVGCRRSLDRAVKVAEQVIQIRGLELYDVDHSLKDVHFES